MESQGEDLFSAAASLHNDTGYEPLAQRMRPRDFSEFIGQEEVVGSGKYLRLMIEHDQIPSLILYGPPGTGKTTLAQMIAGMTGSIFCRLNAVSAGITDIRKIVGEAAEQRKFYQKRTIVFIDEIHRFNKNQQDVLLPYVEDGRLILIGATTENPYFEVNKALLSRVRLIQFFPLKEKDIVNILQQALHDKTRGLGAKNILCAEEALSFMGRMSGGDARIALNILEQAVFLLTPDAGLSIDLLQKIMGGKFVNYDKKGDNHYDVVSAFIKSMRGSDPDAAIHYLARMLIAGEDVNFIARRIAICAAEDVGNADPQALVLAMAAVEAVRFIGMPEARIPLAEAVTYIAAAPKSNAAYVAIDKAMSDMKAKECGEVPEHLCDAHYKGASALGHGKNYIYPHDKKDHFTRQQYLPPPLHDARYYFPSSNGRESFLRTYLQKCWPERGF